MRIWFFDFDGTLSPIVADRGAAELHPACAGMLKDLSRSPADCVAIISSRDFEDILPRVPLDDVIIGGNSGMEWRLPGGCRLSLGADKGDILQARREELLPLIEELGQLPGIEIEDKKWSIAIHVIKTDAGVMDNVAGTISAWALRENIAVHRGPDVFEIQLLPGFNKSVGASFLAGKLAVDSQHDSIIYAGDDENDAIAMWWALMTGGRAIVIGSRVDVPGAMYVKDQQALAEMVQQLRGNS
ncbi:MAG: trehalose-phosphatase [Desulfobacteraceae bacterium]|nr:trehalose-phosphatase [Desulfobacteraceae bacterium]